MEVTISTGDKDFAQLVRGPGNGGSVALVNTMSGSRMDSDEAVMAKFGVRADQIVDLLALMGDSVDNVVGVEKCRSEEHTSELQSLMRISSAVFCLKKKTNKSDCYTK